MGFLEVLGLEDMLQPKLLSMDLPEGWEEQE